MSDEVEALRDELDRTRREADGYLEERAALDAEIARRDELMVRDIAEIRRQAAEIAALREFVRWHFMHHPQSWPGFAEIMPAVRRALEEER